MEPERVFQIIDKYNGNHGGIISMLQDIQSQYGYLPQRELRIVSERTNRSLVDIYGVATFYKHFSLSPKGKHNISVCLGTACHVRGAKKIVEEFERRLEIKPGETTPNGEFTLETMNCLGACALGPIVVVDGHYFSNVIRSQVKQILREASEGLDRVQVNKDQRIFQVDVNCPDCNHSLMDHRYLIDEHPSIKMTVSFERKHGWLRLSSMYGSYSYESEFDIPLDSVIDIFCPSCNAELSRGMKCPDCSAPMVPMVLQNGGMVQICSRRGCKSHMLDLNGVIF